MAKKALPVFDGVSEPLDRRIATGLHKIGLALKHQTWLAASEGGVSPTQGQILAALAQEGALTGSELASRLGLTLPTISDSARALVDKGLVRRAPDPRHPRATLLSLTASGQKRAVHAQAWPELLTAAVGALSPPEQAAFHTGLVKMIRTLQEAGQIPVSRMCTSCVYFQPHAHEGALPHHCGYVDAPMAERHLRLECAEHQPAPPEQRQAAWARFTKETP